MLLLLLLLRPLGTASRPVHTHQQTCSSKEAACRPTAGQDNASGPRGLHSSRTTTSRTTTSSNNSPTDRGLQVRHC